MHSLLMMMMTKGMGMDIGIMKIMMISEYGIEDKSNLKTWYKYQYSSILD